MSYASCDRDAKDTLRTSRTTEAQPEIVRGESGSDREARGGVEDVPILRLNVPVRAVHGFAQCTRNTKTYLRTPIAITSNSTNLDLILAVIEYIKSCELVENILYT